MAFHVIDCFRHIEHALRGKPDPNVTLVDIVNEAGEHLVNCHGWRWLTRLTSLDTVAGQEYVDMPVDFGQVIVLEFTNSLVQQLTPTTLSDIIYKRSTEVGTSLTHYWAIGWHTPTDTGGDVLEPVPRLEAWPGFDTTGTDILRLWYSATWSVVTKETDLLSMPAYMRPLFVAFVRAFASGYEDGEVASLTARVAEVQSGPLMAAARERDAVVQPAYGTLGDRQYMQRSWNENPVLDPP